MYTDGDGRAPPGALDHSSNHPSRAAVGRRRGSIVRDVPVAFTARPLCHSRRQSAGGSRQSTLTSRLDPRSTAGEDRLARDER